MADKEVARHVFEFNPNDNGGENLSLTTIMLDNGAKEIYYNQELTLCSYCNSATFNLVGSPLTPDLLRKLANELEKETIKAELKVKE